MAVTLASGICARAVRKVTVAASSAPLRTMTISQSRRSRRTKRFLRRYAMITISGTANSPRTKIPCSTETDWNISFITASFDTKHSIVSPINRAPNTFCEPKTAGFSDVGCDDDIVDLKANLSTPATCQPFSLTAPALCAVLRDGAMAFIASAALFLSFITESAKVLASNSFGKKRKATLYCQNDAHGVGISRFMQA